MQKILFFDTETTGVPKDYKASYEDVDNWPRVIQLAWILASEDGTIIAQHCDLVKPDGWEIPKEDFWIKNGYSTEKSLEEGTPIQTILEWFYQAKTEADIICGHNLTFDHRIMWAEFIRAGMTPRSGMPKICTMMKGTSLCRLPGTRGFKWPKLEELYYFLFNKFFDNAHDAGADIKATMECFFEMVKRGAITLPEPQKLDL